MYASTKDKTLVATIAMVMLLPSISVVADPLVDTDAKINLLYESPNHPTAVGRLQNGDLFIVEAGEPGSATDGTVTSLACNGTTTLVSSGYYTPGHSRVADGVLYVADRGPNLSAYDPDGIVWQDSGSGPQVLADGFTTPFSLIVSPTEPGKLLVTELAFNPVSGTDGAVLTVDRDDGDVRLFFDDGPSGLANIAGIASGPDQEVYICDNGGANYFRIDDQTTATPIAATGALTFPADIGIDSTGTTYIADDAAGIVRINTDGTADLLIASSGPLRSLLVEDDVITFVESAAQRVWRVDLSAYDSAAMQQIADCMSGPDQALPTCECKYRDEDNDGDCDLHDFAIFQTRFSP